MKKCRNKKIEKYSQGFTLIEILIGTAIFAIVMVITTSVVGQSGVYQNKIRLIRATSGESRKIADMLSRDIREAKGTFKIAYSESGVAKTADYKSGLGVFACDYNTVICRLVTSTNAGANTLIVVDENKVKIYWFVRSAGQAVYYYEYPLTDLNMTTGLIQSRNLNQILGLSSSDVPGGNQSYRLIAGSVESFLEGDTDQMKTIVDIPLFYVPNASLVTDKQAYIELGIESELGLFGGDPKNHAKSSIKTLVTSRSYSY